jgi:ATP-dependent Lhr-like helicase
VKTLAGLEDGSVRAVMVDNVAPSVFAHRILLAWDYSFLDDGERANRRSRSVTMNRAMAEDVFRSEDLAAMLSLEAVERAVAEVQGRTPSTCPRDADELYELIRTHGSLAPATLDDRGGETVHSMAAALCESGRVVRARLASAIPKALVAAEDATLFAAAYPDASFAAPVQAASDCDAARAEVIRRALATSGPDTADGFAARLAIPVDEVVRHLAALEAKGAIFRGHFTSAAPAPGDDESEEIVTRPAVEQWCDRYVLERIHRQTLARLRSEVEPCTDHEFAAFRFRWQQVGAGDLQGVDAVRAAAESLAGLAFAPDFWERAIFPARVAGYRGEYLDLLCMSGELVWVAARAEAIEGETPQPFPARVAFLPRDSAPTHAPEVALDDAGERAVHESLVSSGAQYLDQVADNARLPERDVLAALWRLTAAGLVSNDSFAPLRMLWAERDAAAQLAPTARRQSSSRHDAAIRARLKSSLGGRWSAIGRHNGIVAKGAPDNNVDQTQMTAEILLRRHGVLTREMLALEETEIAWSQLLFALRRMEYAGRIRRGYFVRALSGEQYALPEALELLRAQPSGSRGADCAQRGRSGESVWSTDSRMRRAARAGQSDRRAGRPRNSRFGGPCVVRTLRAR